MFTQNKFAAAPVQVCRKHLKAGADMRGLVINAGVANAGTSARGIRDAEESCRILAAMLKCRPEQILPFSTGIIGEYLPMNRMERGIKKCAAALAGNNWATAARAIMTGDSTTKSAFEIVQSGGKSFTVTGIAKGSSMIHPRMATMLAFIATDAIVPRRQLAGWQRIAAAKSFNAISVDGETSTNDSFLFIATGKAGQCAPRDIGRIKYAIVEVCRRLAESIVRDGEGANKITNIVVRGAKTRAVCRRIAEAVVKSPLVKMAISAGRADAGRLLAAAGCGGHQAQNLNIKVGGVCIIKNGGTTTRREQIQANSALAQDGTDIVFEFGHSPHSWTMKTCGMTRQYMRKFGSSQYGARCRR